MTRNTESQQTDTHSLNTRLTGVTQSVKTGYTHLMRTLGLALFTVVLIVAMAANAKSAEPPAAQPIIKTQPAVHPEWKPAYASQFPGCAAKATGIPATVLVVDERDGQVKRISFDRAWKLTHDTNRFDIVWTVGFCK